MTTKERTGTGAPWSVLCVLMGVLPACGADVTGSSSEPTVGPDGVSVVQEPVLESTCWTSTWPDKIIGVSSSTHIYVAKSADASYGHTTCPHQYVVDLDTIG